MAQIVNPFFEFMYREGKQIDECVKLNPNQTEARKRVQRGNIAKIPHQVKTSGIIGFV